MYISTLLFEVDFNWLKFIYFYFKLREVVIDLLSSLILLLLLLVKYSVLVVFLEIEFKFLKATFSLTVFFFIFSPK